MEINGTEYSLFDLFFTVVLLSFFIASFMRGFLKELLELIGLLGGIKAASLYYEDMGQQLEGLLGKGELATIAGFVLICVLGYLAGTVLSSFGDLVRFSPLNLMNRILGGVVGLLKGLAVVLLIIWVVEEFFPPLEDALDDAILTEYLRPILQWFTDQI